MPSVSTRTVVSKLELGLGVFLFGIVGLYAGWCWWSLPRLGRMTAHGLETRSCNWGTELLAIIVGIVAVATLASGVLSYWMRSNAPRWHLAQIPVLGAWLWLIYVFVFA